MSKIQQTEEKHAQNIIIILREPYIQRWPCVLTVSKGPVHKTQQIQLESGLKVNFVTDLLLNSSATDRQESRQNNMIVNSKLRFGTFFERRKYNLTSE